MNSRKNGPGAAATAAQANTDKSRNSISNQVNHTDLFPCQAVRHIASRYRVSRHISNLICDLQGYGGAK